MKYPNMKTYIFLAAVLIALSGWTERSQSASQFSPDGRYLAYEENTSGAYTAIMLHDFRKDRTVRIFGRKRHRYYVYTGNWSISADARHAVFISENRLMHADKNRNPYVYRRNLRTGTTIRVTETALDGVEGLSMSADGNRIAYASKSPNQVKGDTNQASDIFLYDRSTRTTTRPGQRRPKRYPRRRGQFRSRHIHRWSLPGFPLGSRQSG